MKKICLLSILLMGVLTVSAQQRNYIVVAKDGSGNYRTVQQAFDAIPQGNSIPVTVFVTSGVYKEKLHLDSSKRFVTLIGEDRFGTLLTFDDHTGKITPGGDTIHTGNSFSFLEAADHFTARNITFSNTTGPGAGQAVAVDVTGDQVAFIGCRFIGDQDVLLTNSKNSREYYKNCYIEGTTDFIFGAATAFFEGCHIHSKKNSHVTAASTPEYHPYGYVFYDCQLTADTGVTKADLGRPWRPYASVTFIHCYLGPHIKPQGWSNWHETDRYKTARYAEYESYGPGADPAARVSWSHQLTARQAAGYPIEKVLRGWIPAGSGCE
ncbi:MAG TPA: pectinesterase family protein [Chitinophagaceae bacterium]|nr:pectinesterase family protein [Chitinophagaceae bacterium]